VSTTGTRTVAIVLDPSFAARLASLADRAAVWIVDSAMNRPAIEALWTARRIQQASYDVTVFRPIPDLSSEEHLMGVLRSIQRHADAVDEEERVPLEWIEVYGIAPSPAIEALLRANGFGGSAPLSDGFRARKRRDG